MITERLIGQSCALSVLVFESIAGHSQAHTINAHTLKILVSCRYFSSESGTDFSLNHWEIP